MSIHPLLTRIPTFQDSLVTTRFLRGYSFRGRVAVGGAVGTVMGIPEGVTFAGARWRKFHFSLHGHGSGRAWGTITDGSLGMTGVPLGRPGCEAALTGCSGGHLCTCMTGESISIYHAVVLTYGHGHTGLTDTPDSIMHILNSCTPCS